MISFIYSFASVARPVGELVHDDALTTADEEVDAHPRGVERLGHLLRVLDHLRQGRLDDGPDLAHDVRVLRHVHGAGRRAVAPDPIPDRILLRPMTPDREGRVKSEQTYLHLNCQIWSCAKSV